MTSDLNPSHRLQSIDGLRGLTSLAMIIINSSNPITRPHFLSHSSQLHQPITFADTIFPCFLFTSGLTQAHHRSSPKLQKTFTRASLLCLLGLISNNLLPRLIPPYLSNQTLFNLNTYRIPSVLSRFGIASLIQATGLSPLLLFTIWHGLVCLNPLDPACHSTQAILDRHLFGKTHLHDPISGFDPEGLLGSLLTAPVSMILGGEIYDLMMRSDDINRFTPQLSWSLVSKISTWIYIFTTSIPASKIHWTPRFVGLTTFTSLAYWFIATQLLHFQSIASCLEYLGRASLEIYLISGLTHKILSQSKLWNTTSHWISTRLGLSLRFSDLLIGAGFSLSMIPIAKALVKRNWLIRI